MPAQVILMNFNCYSHNFPEKMRTRSSLPNDIMDDELMSWDEYSPISGKAKPVRRLFSKEEDDTLCKAVSEGYGWAHISKTLVKGRSANSLNQRHNLLMAKRMAEESRPSKKIRLEEGPVDQKDGLAKTKQQYRNVVIRSLEGARERMKQAEAEILYLENELQKL